VPSMCSARPELSWMRSNKVAQPGFSGTADAWQHKQPGPKVWPGNKPWPRCQRHTTLQGTKDTTPLLHTPPAVQPHPDCW
jgi:hypothetical protein